MSAIILDGRKTRDSIIPALKERVEKLSIKPILAIIQVGNRDDSNSFIRAKKNFAVKIGVDVKHIELAETVSIDDVIKAVEDCNNDDVIKGIVVQLPLPANLDRDVVINAIDPKKDVDALTAVNVKKWSEGKEGSIMPATARGVRTLLKKYNISLKGKKVVVVGRSALVGKPIAAMCLNEGAEVSVCHSKTTDLAKETKEADVIIVAVGKIGLINAKHVREGQVIVDVGINTVIGEKLDDEIQGKKLVGDVDFESVKDIVSAITPVPGGVGPMTVISLFENLVDWCEYGG
ncbi:MAG: bifunctional 5,10-methylenetetrahydrofolate dehydrogenase/5,10-methenyltetrahydrofolate cyclohydrolase [Candidatus Paceibacterota bacterium]|jgi:methylenetetrahydrofolate dehydrogenase (NADP+)/methenyltetrahydrofolate cyclohydrolase